MHVFSLIRKASWRKFLLATILSLLSGLSATILIRAIHLGLKNGISDIGDFMINFSLFIILFGISAIISTKMLSGLTQSVLFQLRVGISEKILAANFEKIEYRGSSLLAVLTQDINTISRGFERLPALFTSMTTAIGCLVYLFVLSWQLSVIIVSLFFVIFAVIQISNPKLRKYATQSRKAMVEVYDRFEGLIQGLKELSLDMDHREKFIGKELPESAGKFRDAKVNENINIQISSKISEMILLSAIAGILISITYFEFVSISTFAEFLTVTLFIVTPVASTFEFIKLLKPIEVAFGQIKDIGVELDKLVSKRIAPINEIVHSNHLISLEEISYKYFNFEEDSFFTLGPLDLQVREGELLFIVGGNGSGKTTLAKIIVGLYIPQSGKVKFLDSQIRENQLETYRDKFSALFTDNYLFNKVDYLKEWNQEKANHYLKLLELDKKISFTNQTYSSLRLSSGQRKRLALLTSLLENKKIYLFDEWAANQDSHFKQVFYRKILPDLKSWGKTVIVITHDDKYFDVADRVLKLVDGKIHNSKNSLLINE